MEHWALPAIPPGLCKPALARLVCGSLEVFRRLMPPIGVTFVHPKDHGFAGNGQMMMLELNNLEIAAFLDAWLAEKIC
jgi:hypothetical protein